MSTVTTRPAPLVEAPSLLTQDGTASPSKPFESDVCRDLLHDQLVQRLTRDRAGYQLEDWFTTPAAPEDIAYRHAAFRDLAREEISESLSQFADAVQNARRILAMTQRQHYDLERQRWFLEAALRYTRAVRAFTEFLGAARPSSEALRSVALWLDEYVDSPGFDTLTTEAHAVADQLAAIQYRLRVYSDRVQVHPIHPDEPDYAEEVLDTFSRFQQGAANSYLKETREPGATDHVEAAIAGFVARLHPDAFAALRAFTEHHQPLIPDAVVRLEREAQFYLAYLELLDELAERGLPCSLPVPDADGQVEIEHGYDIVLALGPPGRHTVPNSCQLAPDERLLVVTGPNQGGKTTFARMLGQVHLLARLGVPVPAQHARLPMVDRVCTIFERGENLADQRGHLQDDLLRAKAVVDQAGPETQVLLNEAFAGTTLDDALFLARELLHRLGEADARCVCVTFLDELATLTPHTVSMVAGVEPDNPTSRTFQLERRPADGLAYAHALAKQHRLTREALARRLPR
jgi:hypothetical protein